ncbi:cordon-bleu protein-like 1 isoform X2 [Tenrec ecaudatus]|uniref:cordon-bleu protein-like 1 isoform X2 n=1 Tax=Tenrec ecaudatus TaxID=94439 RepID=UPI003F59A910
MDRRAPRAEDAPAAPLPPAAPTGRKPKAKAPPPPAETKPTDVSSFDGSVESPASVMEQKENTARDIELSVVLPGDVVRSTTVHGSKPMMDLLILLCAQYHLNPSSYTIELLSAEKNPIKFKPNTPIGMLEVEKVILKPKAVDKKKPTPIIPEKTVRVVINFKKTQKTIVRVSPHVSLQELAPAICSKCEFDPLHTLLLKDYQSQEPLDLTKSLNDLGLRELYALDVSRDTSVTAFNKSSLQESCQIPQNLDLLKEKENKGFFSFFQRSKKRREQTASAPATPLISKPRPTFTRSNTISKQYISNTLPSDAPKKRRAPLPPMSSSQSVPQGLAQSQEGPAPCVVKSTRVGETDKDPCGAGMVRTDSLSLSSKSLGSSSLRRTKRKAPSPPSKVPVPQSDDNSHMAEAPPTDSVSEASSPGGLSSPEASPGPGLPSHDQCAAPVLPDGTWLSERSGTSEGAVASLTSGISSDYSLEEIDEKEELTEVPKCEAENISLKSKDSPFGSAGVTNTMKKDPNSALGNDTAEASQNSEEETQEAKTPDGQGPHIVLNTSHEETALDSVQPLTSLGSNKENDQNEVIPFPLKTEDHEENEVWRTEMNAAYVAQTRNTDVKADQLSNHQGCKRDAAANYTADHLTISSLPDQKPNRLTVEKIKMQDAAIQTTPSCNSFDPNHQEHQSSDFRVDESMQTSNNSKSTQHSSSYPQNSVDTSKEFQSQGTLIVQEDQPIIKDPYCVPGNDDLLVPGVDKNANASDLKNYPFYRPKPKPSNEITRCYTPKIGMTTYKIVPPKSLEIVKDWPSETMESKDGQDTHPLGKRHIPENVKETAIQTGDPGVSDGPEKPQPEPRPKPSLGPEQQVQRDRLKPGPRLLRDTGGGAAPFAPSLEAINSALEAQLKSRLCNPQGKPSSFFLQMQKRVAGQYVTSAAAKSVHAAPNPAPKEPTNKEVERSPPLPPEPDAPRLQKAAPPPPEPLEQKAGRAISSQKPAETSPPAVAPKPALFPGSQAAASNLKTLKAFGSPRPFSSSAPSPSPFALAVVKRSQSFKKPRAVPPKEPASEDAPQLGAIHQENNSACNEQNSQLPSPTDCPSLTLTKQSSVTFHSSDPEQIRQSLLTAIRSGEAAAHLKKVAVPARTMSVNGRSRVSHPTAPDAEGRC